MVHGHSTRAFRSSVLVERALARASGTWGGFQAWHPLNADERLQLVDKALGRAANDCSHGCAL